MEGISDIRIIGIDETRPPRIRKEPYINLFFKLSHKAPETWCQDYNTLVQNLHFPAKIEPAEGLIIETWVRKPDEIAATLDELKQAVATCTKEYIERIEAESRAAAENVSDTTEDEGEQGRLNRIIAGLKFDDK